MFFLIKNRKSLIIKTLKKEKTFFILSFYFFNIKLLFVLPIKMKDKL